MSYHSEALKDGSEAASSWWGTFRLLACLTNIVMIAPRQRLACLWHVFGAQIGMYIEYLWAADWPELPAQCRELTSA